MPDSSQRLVVGFPTLIERTVLFVVAWAASSDGDRPALVSSLLFETAQPPLLLVHQ
jgi:hypothetical protein